jgi:hypothetical protein
VILRLGCVLVATAAVALATSHEDAAAQAVARCTPAPVDCSGWYRTNVTVQWSWPADAIPQDCSFRTVNSDTTGLVVGCTIELNGSVRGSTVTIRRDATPPQVTAATPVRPPDEGGWYNRPVAIGVAGADATSGVASCTRPELAGPDGAAREVTATCTDVAGNVSAPMSVALRYDATPPSVGADPDRPPDGGGWYRSPLTVSFSGSDGTSGVESCTGPTRYEGPDQTVKLVGRCRDAAGNSAETTHEFRYDSTPPKLTNVTAKVGKGAIRLAWQRPEGASSMRVVRKPGRAGAASTLLYNGAVGVSFADKSVLAGVAYAYEVSALDEAGNVAQVIVSGRRNRPTLYQPPRGAVVRAPVKLAWEPGTARFFNFQLFRRGVKVLSAWPGSASLRLGKSWRYAGKTYRLAPGLYRWYVWGATGTRKKPKYAGRPLGTSTFVVIRR